MNILLSWTFACVGVGVCIYVTWMFPPVCLQVVLDISHWLNDLGELDELGLVMCSSPYGFWGRWLELLLRGIKDPETLRWPEVVVEMDDLVKCLPGETFPMHVFVKALLLFRSSMEWQNSLVGAAKG